MISASNLLALVLEGGEGLDISFLSLHYFVGVSVCVDIHVDVCSGSYATGEGFGG